MTLEKDEILKTLPKGKLIVAVSGGVDSVVLLDILSKNIDQTRLIVANVDHGIRPDSAADSRFVEELVKAYGLKFFHKKLSLGIGASEGRARDGRYDYLYSVKKKTGASAILTAHHQDDLVETIILNVLRGTNRRGLVPFSSREGLIRPLLNVKKQDIYNYQTENRLEFVEDETNADTGFKRNWVRKIHLNKLRSLNQDFDERLQKIYKSQLSINMEIDELLAKITPGVFWGSTIDRHEYSKLDELTRKEIVVYILRQLKIDMLNIKKGDILRADEFFCNAKPAKFFSPTKQITFKTTKDFVSILLHKVL